MEPSPSTSTQAPQENSLREKKRKLQDAFQTLDEAVQGPSAKKISSQPSGGKKPTISRSIYSTLQKYGISKNSKSESTPGTIFRSNTEPELSARTPHLTAILSRVATKAKSAFTFSFNHDSTLPASAEYRPSSLQSFLSRLETFKLATYSNKPPAIDAVAASRCGWTNDGKDRLVCGLCNSSWVVVGKEGMNRDAANSLIEKQRRGLVDNHKTGCPWKTRQCDPSIYCVPLQTPTATVKDLKENATSLDPLVNDISIRHPLTPNQLASLKKTVSRVKDKDEDAMDVDGDSPQHTLSEAAILASVFGWSLVPPTAKERSRKVSRSASVSASRAGTPSRPFMSASAFNGSASRHGSPSRSASRRSSFSVPDSPSGSIPPLFKLPASLFQKKENTMVQCTLCQRRVGLWAFTPQKQNDTLQVPTVSSPSKLPTNGESPVRARRVQPQRQFDLLKEHRSYCPYVVKSTVVPSIPSSPSASTNGHRRSASSLSHLNLSMGTAGAIEGWRAVLAVASRYGMAQRHKEYDAFGQGAENAGEGSERGSEDGVDNVRSMVAGVKQQGGKELLKYVKNLLG